MAFELQVRERIEAVLDGDKKPEEIPGATSVRCAMGLVLGTLEGITTLSESDAWDYLDVGNVAVVHELRVEYWDKAKEWRQRRAAEKEAIAEAEEAARTRRAYQAREARDEKFKALWDEFDAQRAARLAADGNAKSDGHRHHPNA